MAQIEIRPDGTRIYREPAPQRVPVRRAIPVEQSGQAADPAADDEEERPRVRRVWRGEVVREPVPERRVIRVMPAEPVE